MVNVINELRNWWSNNHTNIERMLLNSVEALINLAIIGVIVNIISSAFYPEFPTRFPTIYGWFDGWLQLVELSIKAALGFLYSLFTGNIKDFWGEYTAAFHLQLQNFLNWMSLIRF